MARFVMRVWLDDRPGALGILTTSLGEAGADVIGINILERDGGRVVDELTVSVPAKVTPDELARHVAALQRVQLEDIRSVVDHLSYPGSDPLDVAVELVHQLSPEALLDVLANGVASVFSADWAVVLPAELDSGRQHVAAAGSPPPRAWLSAFLSGSSAQGATLSGELRGPRDIAWALLASSDASVVLGRGGPPFRSRERHQLAQLARVADRRWCELSLRSGMLAHPSRTRQPSPA
ncbi:MAG: ACT domain-containing protein [Acidimicrobiales bacterium]